MPTPLSLPSHPLPRVAPVLRFGLLLGLLLGLWTLGAALAAEPAPGRSAVIGFDIGALDADGLIGPADGKRSLDYEYCIPRGAAYAAEVRAIDPSARLNDGSRGRIGCGPAQVLVLGNTHQPGFADVLKRLAALPYVERIEQTFFE